MFTIFIYNNDFDNLYITTVDNYSRAIIDLQMCPDRVKWINVSLESLLLLKDGQRKFIKP